MSPEVFQQRVRGGSRPSQGLQVEDLLRGARLPAVLAERLQVLGASSGASRMTGGQSFIQPSVVAFGPSLAAAFYRCRTHEKKIGAAVTTDAGAAWSEPKTLSLPNPDAGLDALLLSDQRILLAFNDSPVNRETLRLAVSIDRGDHWTRIATLESAVGIEFSYPYMIRTQDGRIHLVYTWDRKRIQHVVFNDAWLDAQMKGTIK